MNGRRIPEGRAATRAVLAVPVGAATRAPSRRSVDLSVRANRSVTLPVSGHGDDHDVRYRAASGVDSDPCRRGRTRTGGRRRVHGVSRAPSRAPAADALISSGRWPVPPDFPPRARARPAAEAIPDLASEPGADPPVHARSDCYAPHRPAARSRAPGAWSGGSSNWHVPRLGAPSWGVARTSTAPRQPFRVTYQSPGACSGASGESGGGGRSAVRAARAVLAADPRVARVDSLVDVDPRIRLAQYQLLYPSPGGPRIASPRLLWPRPPRGT